MDAFADNSCWDFLDSNFLNDAAFGDFDCLNPSGGQDITFSCPSVEERVQPSAKKECPRKRGHNELSSRATTKACREKIRRERLNDRFLDLSYVLEPGRPVKTDKPAILDDAIRVLNQLRAEAKELKETNEMLLEEIKTLKVEKNELREEKQLLKTDKERMEQQLKAMPSASGFVPAHHPAAYHATASKMAVFPSYGFVPMWQYLPSSARDTSHDHELRPPAA